MAKRSDRRTREELLAETEVVEPGGELPERAYHLLADLLAEYAKRELAKESASNETTSNGGAT